MPTLTKKDLKNICSVKKDLQALDLPFELTVLKYKNNFTVKAKTDDKFEAGIIEIKFKTNLIEEIPGKLLSIFKKK